MIIEELAGKIVQMSQQKFASNVVEKCLTFGGPSERQLLVDEMLGTTDENEPLQVGYVWPTFFTYAKVKFLHRSTNTVSLSFPFFSLFVSLLKKLET